MLPHQLIITQPFPCLMQRNDVQHGGIGRAVIRGVGNLLEIREFPRAEFVRNLSGLCIAIVVAIRGLQIGESRQGAAREVRIHDHILKTDDQTISAKDRDEPGDAGCGEHFLRMIVVTS